MRLSSGSTITRLIVGSTIVGFLVRLLGVFIFPASWDGGIFLYWANLINGGALPYRDFFIRDPVYIYLVAGSVRVFGTNYLALSLVSVVPSVLTIPFLYKIAKEVFDITSGVVSAVVYSLAPTVVWYSTVFDERSLMLFISMIALWMLVKSLKYDSFPYLALFGFILGIGTFAYRGIAIYVVSLPLLLAFRNVRSSLSWKLKAKVFAYRTIIAWGAFFIAFGSIFLLFAHFSSLSWMVSNFGFSGAPESAGWFIWGQVASLSFRDRIFYVAIREWFYLVVPVSVVMLALLFRRLLRRKNLALGLATAGASAILLATLADTTSIPQTSFGAYEPSRIFVYAFFGFIVLLSGTAVVALRAISHEPAMLRLAPIGSSLLVFWFLATCILILLFGIPLVNYYYYFAPIFVLLSSPVMSTVLKRIRLLPNYSFRSVVAVRGPILFLLLLLANASVSAVMLYSTPMTWRNQSTSSVYDIASYIQANTTPQDEILVGNPAIALFAHRGTALGITQLQQYGRAGPEPFIPYSYDPFHLFPGVAQIAQFMASGGVKYVVGDTPTLSIVFIHPLWKFSFLTNFVWETNIDGIDLYRYSPTYDLSQHLESVYAFTNSTPYQYTNYVWTDVFGHQLIASQLHNSLPTVGGTTRVNQVMFHPPYGGGRSYMIVTLLANQYSSLTTSFALADGSLGKTTGVTYAISVAEGTRQISSFSQLVNSTRWQEGSLQLPVNVDLTLVLTSSSGFSSSYNWLQVTLTLS